MKRTLAWADTKIGQFNFGLNFITENPNQIVHID